MHLMVDLRKQSTKEMWPTEVEKANNIFINTFQMGFIKKKKKTLQKSKGFLGVKSEEQLPFKKRSDAHTRHKGTDGCNSYC